MTPDLRTAAAAHAVDIADALLGRFAPTTYPGGIAHRRSRWDLCGLLAIESTDA
jgi:hypothetical protein